MINYKLLCSPRQVSSRHEGISKYITVSATYVILAGSPLKINPNQFSKNKTSYFF